MVELAGQMRKLRFRESSTVCQMTPSKKGHKAGPGVRGVRMAEVRWHIEYQMQCTAPAGSGGQALTTYKAAAQQASALLQPGLAQLTNSRPGETSLQPLLIKLEVEG